MYAGESMLMCVCVTAFSLKKIFNEKKRKKIINVFKKCQCLLGIFTAAPFCSHHHKKHEKCEKKASKIKKRKSRERERKKRKTTQNKKRNEQKESNINYKTTTKTNETQIKQKKTYK